MRNENVLCYSRRKQMCVGALASGCLYCGRIITFELIEGQKEAMAATKLNKFDPAPEPEKFEPEKCTEKLHPTAEEFLVFCRRALGTSAVAPLVVAGEPLNGASIGNLAEAFAICYGLGKQATKAPMGADDPLAARRAALEEKRTDA